MKTGTLSGEVPFTNLKKYFPKYNIGNKVTVKIISPQNSNNNNNLASVERRNTKNGLA